MTVVTTKPNGTSASSGFGATGAASRHAATNDASDSSYIRGDGTGGDSVLLQFAEPTIPSGGLVKTLALRARLRKDVSSPPGVLYYTLWPDAAVTADSADSAQNITWNGITTVTLVPDTRFASAPADVQVGLRVTGTGSLIDIFELYVDTVYVAKPVTAPSAPSGTLTATNLPAVQWANTLDADGGPQTHYVVKVFSAAQYGAGGFDPATSTPTVSTVTVREGADTSWTPTVVLPNATYRAYVWVAQTVNGVAHWSDPAYTGFVINASLPAVPDTPVLTAEPVNGRIKVHVEGNSGSATTTHLEVQRSEDGATWEPLRLLTDTAGVIAGTSADLYDYEAPNGTVMSYRVRAHHTASDLVVASAWATVAAGSWSSSDWWLKCPESPTLNQVVTPHSIPSYQRPARQGVFQPLGRADTVIVADKRGAPRGTLALDIDTYAQAVAIDELLDAQLPLLLQAPPQHHWPDRYIWFGDQDRARWIDKAWIEPVVDTLAWFEVLPPPGVIDGWPA